MTLVKRNSTSFPTVPRLFDDFFTENLFNWGTNNFATAGSSLPQVNILETKDAFEVEMAAPGMDKKDFQIELDNEILKISVEKEVENNFEEDVRFVRREYNFKSFQRTFHLSKKVVDEAKIEAKYKDGVLQILIPKKEEAKQLPPRTIQIK